MRTTFAFAVATAFTLAMTLTVTGVARADMNSAFQAYQSKDYNRAAVELFDVMQKDSSLPNRQQAEFLLGKTLHELGYYIPAIAYYRSVIFAGETHPSHKEAWSNLVDLARLLKDDFIVPTIINTRFDADARTLGSLTVERRNAINYMFGALMYRQTKYDDAVAFLSANEDPNSPYYPRARYLMGVINVRKNNNKGAIELFKQVQGVIKEDEEDEERLSIRNLATLGVARAQYALGDFAAATAAYRAVPRYSKEWFDALFEDAWSYFQQEDYGRALGEIESVLSPYFNKRYRAEAYYLGALVYFSNCQFDRTRLLLDAFADRYQPAQEQLNAYTASDRKDSDFYRDLVNSSKEIPVEILRQVRRNGRFLNYHRIITEINREQEILGRADNWRSASLRGELESILKDQKDAFETYTGKWVKGALKKQTSELGQFINNARLLKIETATEEKNILEAGGDIAGKRRKRLPRPDIPNDQYQHWQFAGEYWIDEIGYYVHSVRKECSELGVAQ